MLQLQRVGNWNRALTKTLALAVLVGWAGNALAAPPNRIFDGAAREIISNMKAGNGWCVVTDRQRVALIADAEPIDCLKYAVVTGYQETNENGQTGVTLQYGPETPWIAVQCNGPTASGPSLTAAKQFNAAIGEVDKALAGLVELAASSDQPEVHKFVTVISAFLRQQRTAMVDFIQKDIAAIR